MERIRKDRRHRGIWLLALLTFLLGLLVAQGLPYLHGRVREAWWDWRALRGEALPRQNVPIRHEGFAAGVSPAQLQMTMRGRGSRWTGQEAVWLHNPGRAPVIFELGRVSPNTGGFTIRPARVRVNPGEAVRVLLLASSPAPRPERVNVFLDAAVVREPGRGSRLVLRIPLQLHLTYEGRPAARPLLHFFGTTPQSADLLRTDLLRKGV